VTAGRRTAGSPRRRSAALVLLGALVLAACSGEGSGKDDPASSASGSATGPNEVRGLAVGERTVTLTAAGDIARRPEDGKGTAALIGQVEPDAVLTLGDNAYDDGTLQEYEDNYDPTWGKFKRITRPVPGNHEYGTPGASGYFTYFRDQVKDNPYYAWDLGTWRMYALNCDIDCGNDSEQVEWLRQDLAKYDKPALAYLHDSFFTCSTRHPPARRLDDIWQTLQSDQGQILLGAHNHSYERFARLDADGQPTEDGLRQFVVGTGGGALYQLADECQSREAGDDENNGILELTLEPDSFSWRFLAVDGTVVDEGSDQVR